MIGFRQHDLLDEPIGIRAFDLVLCRNVVIYFTDGAKTAVHRAPREGPPTRRVALRRGDRGDPSAATVRIEWSDGPGFYVRVD